MGYPLIQSTQFDGLFAEGGMVYHGKKPDKVEKVSDNEVYAVYGKYKQTITAEGSGNERHNFVETITEVSGNDV